MIDNFLDDPFHYLREILIVILLVMVVYQNRKISEYEDFVIADGTELLAQCVGKLQSCVDDMQELFSTCAPRRGRGEVWVQEDTSATQHRNAI